jgi:DNA polymerase III delta subunit
MTQTPKSNFRIPKWILDEIKRRSKNMTKYIIQALQEKFERDDKKKI